MKLFHFMFMLIFLLLGIESNGQHAYLGNVVLDCDNSVKTNSSLEFLYTCNGQQPTCPAYLIFRTQPLYNTIMNISKLLSTDPTELARFNTITNFTQILPLNKELIIPVTCSCSGQNYQANTSYVIHIQDENYFTIANSTYEGLTTCVSLERNNIYDVHDLQLGYKLHVPLRCACPTIKQTIAGIKYLLTYLITWDDTIEKIGTQFNVSSQDLALANGFSSLNDEIFPFTTLVVPLLSKPSSYMTRTFGQDHSFWKKSIIVGTIAGSLFAIICCLFAGYLWWRKNRANRCTKVERVLPRDIKIGIASTEHMLQIYTFKELDEATNGFSLDNRLSASVYKGSLREKTVAIKQMCTNSPKEVKILQKINHFNLISLYGVCEHDGCCYLVYEFMENGSLKEWLEDKTTQESQTWNNRIHIALDVAMGLQYLHNFANPAYVHKDINTSNILLTKELRAKITKFGLARSTEKDQSGNLSIKCPLESKGYLAPEYLESGYVTTETDVYAFGVVLLELITGKRAVYEHNGYDYEEEVMLSEEFISCMCDEKYAKDKVNDVIDPRLQARHPLGFVIDQSELTLRMIKLSMACLEHEPSRRLSMNKIVSTLMMIQRDAHCSEINVIES